MKLLMEVAGSHCKSMKLGLGMEWYCSNSSKMKRLRLAFNRGLSSKMMIRRVELPR